MKRLAWITAFCLPVLLLASAALTQQPDPRWTDDDPNNDPNTCFESGNCITETDWKCGWSEARQQDGMAGLDECLDEEDITYGGSLEDDEDKPLTSPHHSATQATDGHKILCAGLSATAIAKYHEADKSSGTDARKNALTNAVATQTSIFETNDC